MATTPENAEELGLQDEDRLPWLEAVDEDEDIERVSTGKLVGFVAAALIALGIVVGGVWWLNGQKPGADGDGTLIAAQQGDYKVKPEDKGGMQVEGQGDSTFATSEGAVATGKVDASAQPEAPMTGAKASGAAPKPVAAGKASVSTAVPTSGGRLTANSPAPSPGTTIQLGAFDSAATADSAWRTAVARNAALGRLTKSVVRADVNGRTYYRLRADAGSAANAAALCRQLGNCLVVR